MALQSFFFCCKNFLKLINVGAASISVYVLQPYNSSQLRPICSEEDTKVKSLINALMYILEKIIIVLFEVTEFNRDCSAGSKSGNLALKMS